MSVNWRQFEESVTSLASNRRSDNEREFASALTTEYIRAVLNCAQDIVLGNNVITVNKALLESALQSGFTMMRLLRSQVDAEAAFNAYLYSGLGGFWAGAQLGLLIPPPGAVTVVSNLVVNIGTRPRMTLPNVKEADVFSSNLAMELRLHLTSISVLTTGVSSTGIPIAVPIYGLK